MVNRSCYCLETKACEWWSRFVNDNQSFKEWEFVTKVENDLLPGSRNTKVWVIYLLSFEMAAFLLYISSCAGVIGASPCIAFFNRRAWCTKASITHNSCVFTRGSARPRVPRAWPYRLKWGISCLLTIAHGHIAGLSRCIYGLVLACQVSQRIWVHKK